MLRSSAAAAANTTTTNTILEADAIGVSPGTMPGSSTPPTTTTGGVNVNFNAGKMIDNLKSPGVGLGVGLSMGAVAAAASVTLTGSSRSSSVTSEELGSIEITHEEGLNSEAGGGGAYLEVRARPTNRNLTPLEKA